MSASAVLAAEQLTVARGGHRVLDGMTFTVAQGDVFALLGGNGAGKSTTLLTFLGFIVPTGGRALVFGQDVQADRAQVHRRSAYLPETASLYAHLSARENLDYFLSLAKTERTAADQEAALDEVGLASSARGQALERYSKGMRQKVAIALAILRETPLLLLDEPTSGLDPVAIDEFNALIQRLAAQGTTTLMVTHDLYGACQVASRIGVMREGALATEFVAEPGQGIALDDVRHAFTEAVA